MHGLRHQGLPQRMFPVAEFSLSQLRKRAIDMHLREIRPGREYFTINGFGFRQAPSLM